jgi:hypothetical protein
LIRARPLTHYAQKGRLVPLARAREKIRAHKMTRWASATLFLKMTMMEIGMTMANVQIVTIGALLGYCALHARTLGSFMSPQECTG